MQKLTVLRNHMMGVGAVPFIAALALLLAPIFGLTYGAGVATATLFGGAAVLLWGKSAIARDRVDPWLTVAVGVCAVLSPWLIGFSYMSSASFAIHTLAGLVIAGAGVHDLLKAREPEKAEAATSEAGTKDAGPDGAQAT